MKKNDFLVDMADILEVDLTELDDDFLLDNKGKWNSLAVVATIALIDEQFNIMISGDELRECTSIGALWDLIQERK